MYNLHETKGGGEKKGSSEKGWKARTEPWEIRLGITPAAAISQAVLLLSNRQTEGYNRSRTQAAQIFFQQPCLPLSRAELITF